MNREKILAWVVLLLSLVLLLLPRIIPICTGLADSKPMVCHYTYQAEFLVTLLAVIVAGGLFVLRTAEARLLSGFILALLGIIVVVLPQSWAIGLCTYGGCQKTVFFSVGGGGLLALVGAAIAWNSARKIQTAPENREENVNLEKLAASEIAKSCYCHIRCVAIIFYCGIYQSVIQASGAFQAADGLHDRP